MWPVLLMGSHSVMPWMMPKTTVLRISITNSIKISLLSNC